MFQCRLIYTCNFIHHQAGMNVYRDELEQFIKASPILFHPPKLPVNSKANKFESRSLRSSGHRWSGRSRLVWEGVKSARRRRGSPPPPPARIFCETGGGGTPLFPEGGCYPPQKYIHKVSDFFSAPRADTQRRTSIFGWSCSHFTLRTQFFYVPGKAKILYKNLL